MMAAAPAAPRFRSMAAISGAPVSARGVLPLTAMQATLFEFRHRWWVIFFIFCASFWSYFFDPVNSGQAIADTLGKWSGRAATRNDYRLIFAAGAFLVALASLWRTWGTSYLRAEVMRDARVRTEKLVADGPYRHVRNPLYLGNILLAAGLGLMASRTGFAILVLGLTVFVLRLILREEAELREHQGEPYRRYCAAVPRLVPSLLPRVAAGGNVPQWGQGFRAELMYWMFAVAMGAFAWTLNIKIFWGGAATAMVAAFLEKRPETKQP